MKEPLVSDEELIRRFEEWKNRKVPTMAHAIFAVLMDVRDKYEEHIRELQAEHNNQITKVQAAAYHAGYIAGQGLKG